MPAKLKSAVLGASGYSGLELTRILDTPSAAGEAGFAAARRHR